MSGKSVLKRVDWLTVLFYLLLVTIGWVNIYSSTFSESDSSIFDFGTSGWTSDKHNLMSWLHYIKSSLR